MPVEVAGLGETQHADATLVWLLSAVYPHVLGQRRRVAERLLAHAASGEDMSASVNWRTQSVVLETHQLAS